MCRRLPPQVARSERHGDRGLAGPRSTRHGAREERASAFHHAASPPNGARAARPDACVAKLKLKASTYYRGSCSVRRRQLLLLVVGFFLQSR